MKRYPYFLLLSVLLLLTPTAVIAFDADADVSKLFKGLDGCFVLHDLQSGQTLKHNVSRCDKRTPPCSTFKIPHAKPNPEDDSVTGRSNTCTNQNRESGWFQHFVREREANLFEWLQREP